MIIVVVKYFLPFFLTEKTDTINATSEISNPNTEKAPGTKLGARPNNANAIASHPATMLISTPLIGIGKSLLTTCNRTLISSVNSGPTGALDSLVGRSVFRGLAGGIIPQRRVEQCHGCGIPRSLQIFFAKLSFTSLYRGTALRCSGRGYTTMNGYRLPGEVSNHVWKNVAINRDASYRDA